MKNQLALFAVVGFVLLACKGGGEPAGSCDRRAVVGWESCFDYPKDQVTSGKSSCGGENAGIWKDAACEHASALGGCKMSSGITKWFFVGTEAKTADEAKLKCSGDWVGPSGK